MTAYAALKANYVRYLYIGFLIAVLIHAVAFAFWPEYIPGTYKLREVKIPEWIDFEPERVIPPPPKEVDPPDIPVDITPSDEPDAEETIHATVFEPTDPPPRRPKRPEGPAVYFGFDKRPELKQGARPEYPDLARKAEVEGTVDVYVTVDEQGTVINAWIARSDAEIFNDAALEAAYRFVFTPGEQNGIPVKATISIPFRFTLRN